MKTKSIICTAMLVFSLAACSSYYQIATISSDNVKLTYNGEFSYIVGDITVYYNFWSEYGSVAFVVENNSPRDVKIDFSKSFFVKNGFAYDYFRNRTDVYTVGSTSASEKLVSTSSYMIDAVSKNTAATAYVETRSGVVAVGIESPVSNSIIGAESKASASMSSHSIEYKEVDLVTIPAHSAKAFGEYSVASGEFVKCGLIRNPSGKENAVVKYNESNSPIMIENRLVLVVDGQEIPVTSKFYVSKFENLPERKVLRDEELVDCAGKKNRVFSEDQSFRAIK